MSRTRKGVSVAHGTEVDFIKCCVNVTYKDSLTILTINLAFVFTLEKRAGVIKVLFFQLYLTKFPSIDTNECQILDPRNSKVINVNYRCNISKWKRFY